MTLATAAYTALALAAWLLRQARVTTDHLFYRRIVDRAACLNRSHPAYITYTVHDLYECATASADLHRRPVCTMQLPLTASRGN